MRFSLLTLNLNSVLASQRTGSIDRLARFVAEQNLTALCLQGCEQSQNASLVETEDSASAGSAGVRWENPAYRLRSQLEEYGLKYGLAWEAAREPEAAIEEGPAILSQLPVLGRCSRDLSSSDRARGGPRFAVMARLAVSPTAVIDLYSVRLEGADSEGSEQLSAVSSFVEDTPRMLDEMQPPLPKRRGPPRKKRLGDEPPVATRLICVAGSFDVASQGEVQALARVRLPGGKCDCP